MQQNTLNKDEEMYDEFGNYIGQDLLQDDQDSNENQSKSNDSDDDIESQIRIKQRLLNQQNQNNQIIQIQENEDQNMQIVLHEDKQYYPDAAEIFGQDVEAIIEEEDHQPITQPIIQPPQDKFNQIYSKIRNKTYYSDEYMVQLMAKPQFIRNIAILGALHHGKTLLSDMLIQGTYQDKIKIDNSYQNLKLTDSRVDEIERKISLKAAPFQILLKDSKDKSFVYNVMDTPGHPDFIDEVLVSLRFADNVILVVDVFEGCTMQTDKIIQLCLKYNKQIIVFLNKIDRLVLEIKVPPEDAYQIIKRCLDNINIIMQKYRALHPNNKQQLNSEQYFSPLHDNVIFGSTQFGICFSLRSFAQFYQQKQIKIKQLHSQINSKQNHKHGANQRSNQDLIDVEKFSKFLWGPILYDLETRKFQKQTNLVRQEENLQLSFVYFILEPIYKLFQKTMTSEKDEIFRFLHQEFNVDKKLLNKNEFDIDIRPLLSLVFQKAFPQSVNHLIDIINSNFLTADQTSKLYIQNNYTQISQTDLNSHQIQLRDKISLGKSQGPLCINILKQFYDQKNGEFNCYGKIISGTISQGQKVKVLGEQFTPEEQEDMVVSTVQNIYLMMDGGRYKVQVDKLSAGNWVLISGIDQSILKTATLFAHDQSIHSINIFRPIDFGFEPVIKLACEPLNPSELPKMIDGLRKATKSYPMCKTKVEESGEHLIMGTGELYLDQIMHDIRNVFNRDFEIKVSEPFVSISETIADTSSVKCQCETPNKKNTICMIAQPLQQGLDQQIQQMAGNFSGIEQILENQFQWDALTASSVWSFGPQNIGSNMLIDYSLDFETDKQKLFMVKNSIIQGFQWASREGPLCEEPMRNVNFKFLQGNFSDEPVYRGGGQIIPTTRRAAYCSFLLANPRIMEPILHAEIICPQDCIQIIYNILLKRRAHVFFEEPRSGTPFHTLKIEIPALESFGFETDIRTATIGQAMVLSQFNNWQMVPGDPLEKSIQLMPLEPSPIPHLARELMVKTRRRKGLMDDVSVVKFFDSSIIIEQAKKDMSLKTYF